MIGFVKGVFKAILWFVAIAIAIPVLGLAYGFLSTDAPAPSAVAQPAAEEDSRNAALAAEIPGYQRPEESTFLTYPEWSIVYAARDYAAFLPDNNPADFPYFAYVGRFWQDYAAMIRATSPYPLNTQNHLMLMVIGISHTVEHVIQGVYENTVGRLTWLTGGSIGEDGLLATTAMDYAAFLDQVPWYQFPYADARAELWDMPPAPGLSAIRSWERKAGFGLALTIKQAYAQLIKMGLSATSDPAAVDIYVWATGPVSDAIAGEADTRLVRDLGENGAVFVTKRYQVFTDMIPRLVDKGLAFVRIGGNDEILLTVLSDEDIGLPDGARSVFAYPSPINPAEIRTGLSVPVAQLHEIVPDLTNSGARLEHVYDY